MNGVAASPGKRHFAVGGAAAFAVLCLTACAERVGEPPVGPSNATPPRVGRFGSLRDLVLMERPHLGPAAALFVDRFEVTNGDWQAFARTDAGRAVGANDVPTMAGAALPVGGVDLRRARAFARWRFLRLPRVEEWQFASSGGGRSRFPWGDREEWTKANTGDLGLGQSTPVGTFESGRRIGGDSPYDLVGNVSEWTETIAENWWFDDGDRRLPSYAAWAARTAVLRAPALTPWQLPGGTVPLVWLAIAAGDAVPRAVVGADFQTPMRELVEHVPAGDRRQRTGLRLFATAAELLDNLCADGDPLAAADRDQLVRFVRRGRHLPVLAAVWLEHDRAAPAALASSAAAVLRSELTPTGSTSGR